MRVLSIEHITQHFYARFQREHTIFASFIQGMPSLIEREWYASLMLNRLMFVYFIQKKGFLDNNVNYLNDKMSMVQASVGRDKFLSFYRRLLLRLFHEGLDRQKRQRTDDLDRLLGNVPFLNSDLIEVHEMGPGYSNVAIPDEAFIKFFAFFEAYHWHIDDRPLTGDDEINPDVISYIFEKYINQKQMGAYYTAEDITAYISKHTIMPYILNTVQESFPQAFAAKGSLWCHFQAHLDRYIPPAILSEDYLPVETEREYQCRKARRAQINKELSAREYIDYRDFITYNLNAQRFASDIILQCTDGKLLRTFYEIILHMAILDPTCGSGAFLFAALNILEPLYRACIERIQSLLELNKLDSQREQQEYQLCTEDKDYFQALLNQICQHANCSYFILKSITTHNLYGVDIMREAVETCKLRLFLKLAAQLKDRTEIGLLHNLDFNIRHGNTLVGFTSYGEIQKAIVDTIATGTDVSCPHQPGEGSHGHDTSVPAEIGGEHDTSVLAEWLHIDKVLQDIERKHLYFRQIETQNGERPDNYEAEKQVQSRHRKRLALKLNRYLASTYGIDRRHISAKRSYAQQFREWCLSHQPFHWFIEFYSVMQRGGFDVIIGNPPYVEYSKVCREYQVPGYENKSYGNLYAVILERSLQLVRPGQSHLGLIVPLSICGSGRFKALRQTIKRQVNTCWLANFEIFPCGLFSGPNQRLSIFLARHEPTPTPMFNVTGKQRWYAQERPHLLDLIAYTKAKYSARSEDIPKLASPLQEHILHKIMQQARGEHVAQVLSQQKTEHFVYYQEATNYWIKATCCVPYYKKNGLVMTPSHGRFLYFNDERTAHTVMSLLNSSLFYVWFVTYSDGFHLSHALVKAFPVDKALYALPELSTLAVHLHEDIKSHIHIRTRNTRPNANKLHHQIELEEYHMHHSKPIIDEIDRVLARRYGLTDEELDFIINYEIKYRLGLNSR
jgi:Eco57I restriction-modification methylase